MQSAGGRGEGRRRCGGDDSCWRRGATRLGLRRSVRRDLLVELPPPALLQEAPHDDEARHAGVVHEGDVHCGGCGRPQNLVYRKVVDGGTLYLVGLLARDPAGLIVLAPEGGAKVGVGPLEVPRPYCLVVILDGGCDRGLLAQVLAGRVALAAGHSGRGVLAAGRTGSLFFAGVARVERPDAGREVDVGIRVQRGPRSRVLLHDLACGHRFTRRLPHPAKKETRFIQLVLRLWIAETHEVRDFCYLWSLTDREECLRALLRLVPARHRLL